MVGSLRRGEEKFPELSKLFEVSLNIRDLLRTFEGVALIFSLGLIHLVPPRGWVPASTSAGTDIISLGPDFKSPNFYFYSYMAFIIIS
jgi:hypothetical protein